MAQSNVADAWPKKARPRAAKLTILRSEANGEWYWRGNNVGSRRPVAGPEETYKRRETMLRVLRNFMGLTPEQVETLKATGVLVLPR